MGVWREKGSTNDPPAALDPGRLDGAEPPEMLGMPGIVGIVVDTAPPRPGPNPAPGPADTACRCCTRKPAVRGCCGSAADAEWGKLDMTSSLADLDPPKGAGGGLSLVVSILSCFAFWPDKRRLRTLGSLSPRTGLPCEVDGRANANCEGGIGGGGCCGGGCCGGGCCGGGCWGGGC